MINNNQTILHELFCDDNTIGVLGHLLVTRDFDFSLEELARINDLKPIELNKILDHLIDFGLIKYRHGKYSYGEANEQSKAFELFFKHLLLWNLERLSRK